MDGQIAALRHWSKGRAREAASTRGTPGGGETTGRPATSRRISRSN